MIDKRVLVIVTLNDLGYHNQDATVEDLRAAGLQIHKVLLRSGIVLGTAATNRLNILRRVVGVASVNYENEAQVVE